MERIITINYEPREWSNRLHNTTSRWNVIVAHRRSGKTVASLNHLLRDALLKPKARFAYISPTYKQSKQIAWDYLKEFSRAVPDIKINESELRIDYPNGSRITLYGADNPDSLRGIALWGVIFDEYSQQPSNIFTEIIRPALADNKGYAIWIGTPKGKNDFYRLFEKAEKDSTWLALKLTVDDTGVIPKEEIEDAKKVMTADEFQQEFYCSFEAAIKGAYYAEQLEAARKDKRITKVKYDSSLPVHTWWDLGIGDATAIGFFQNIGNEWRMIDYLEAEGEGLQYYVQRLKEKGYIYGEHWFPHDVQVRELGTGKSRQETLEQLGLSVNMVPKQAIDDGIHAVRTRFNTLWIDEDSCQFFLDAISQYQKEWDDKRGMFKPKPNHNWTSHAADMLRYWAVTEEPSRVEYKSNYLD